MLRILFLVLLASQVSAQGIKIGDIEIPIEMAKEYFLDCYANPDTINVFTYLGVNRYVTSDKETMHKIGKLKMRAIRKKGDWEYIIPRKPTASDFAKWFRKRYAKK